MAIKKVVFATDFSAGSRYAAPYAADLARGFGAKLYIIHVLQDTEKMVSWYAPRVNLAELQKAAEEKSRQELEQCCTEALRSLDGVEYRLLKGAPYEQILKFQQDNDADMIIVSTIGGHNAGRKNAFGSTTDRILKNATCSVLAVPPPADAMPESFDPRLCSDGEIRF